jgi:hypothetical protein
MGGGHLNRRFSNFAGHNRSGKKRPHISHSYEH